MKAIDRSFDGKSIDLKCVDLRGFDETNVDL